VRLCKVFITNDLWLRKYAVFKTLSKKFEQKVGSIRPAQHLLVIITSKDLKKNVWISRILMLEARIEKKNPKKNQ
jgi:hypothetical protein